MKCFECKKEIDQASRVHYVWYDCYNEPIGEKGRDVCKECYPKLTFNKTHHIVVKSGYSRAL